jgi:hypothetical protein
MRAPRPLAASDVLRAWELGQDRHPVDRALCLLRLACPDTPWQELAELPVGRRDALLFALREQTFGRAMNGRVTCPACAAQAELALDTAALVVPAPDEVVDMLEEDGITLRFRLPDSLDLAAVARAGDPEAAHALLLERCVLTAERAGAAMRPRDLPPAIEERLEAIMAEQDPQGEVLLHVTCMTCGHRWQALLDIEGFLWTEVSAEATRLLGEVHTLARAYHWREADILAMSSRRREAYLELSGA